MARIEHIRQRLENWARWSAQRESGGLGFPKSSTFARLAGGGRNDGIPVSSLDAMEIEDAVRSLQLTRSHLYLTLSMHYGKGMTIAKVSRHLHKAESTIKRHLEDADRAIDQFLQVKRLAQDLRRERK